MQYMQNYKSSKHVVDMYTPDPKDKKAMEVLT